MNRTSTLLSLFVTWAITVPATADEDVKEAMKQDVILRALVNELDRSKDGLKLEGLERPYFLEYALHDSASVHVSASLGAVTGSNSDRRRSLRTDIRVGSYQLDNTNFQGDFGRFSFGGMFGDYFGGAAIPIEDDYNAIRQSVWWSTDRKYKSVVEDLERKKAFMQSKMIEDKPEDFSTEKPATHLEDRVNVTIDRARLEKMAADVSSLFRSHPEIQSSSVTITGGGGNNYLVNTEGTRIRIGGLKFSISVNATVQSDDGMKLADSVQAFATRMEELPSVEEMHKRCETMIEQLSKVKDAPKLESYTGPVLMDAAAATKLFSQQFAAHFTGGQRPVGGQATAEDFEKKIGTQILPKSITVVDDPTKDKIGDDLAMGHYEYDDQGVKSKPVTLVKDGKLEALLMSRNPSKKFKQSTGHGRGTFRPTATCGSLIVSAKDGKDDKALKQQLADSCKEEDHEFAIRIASLGSSPSGGGQFDYMEMLASYGMDFGGGRGQSVTPLVMYKVYPDGKEELVRGAEIAKIDQKTFKRIKAAGKKPYVLNTAPGSMGMGVGKTVAAPALLFEELDVAKIDRDFDKPPILPTPLARGKAQD